MLKFLFANDKFKISCELHLFKPKALAHPFEDSFKTKISERTKFGFLFMAPSST